MYKTLIFVALVGGIALAKPPRKDVKPLVHGGVRYVASHRLKVEGTDGGGSAYIEAWDARNKKKLWEAELYTNDSVRGAFITAMKVEGGKLVVSNQRKETYEVDLESHEVQKRQ